MGVYINMDMPKPGRYEAVIIVLDKSTAEIAISPAEDDIGYWKEYPLVPVPPHGRLIDADAMCDGLVLNNPVVIYAECMPTVIPEESAKEEAR